MFLASVIEPRSMAMRDQARNSRSKAALATSPCPIWRSTASFAVVMTSPSGSRMSPLAGTRQDSKAQIQSYSSGQFVEQRLCGSQIGGFEALSEPAEGGRE